MFTPSTVPRITTEMPSNRKVPCALVQSMTTAMVSPTGILWLTTHCSKPPGRGGGAARARARSAGWPSRVRTPASQAFTMVGFAFSHSAAARSGCSCRSRMAAIISLSPRRVNCRLCKSLPTFGHSAARDRVDRRAAKIRSEHRIPAGEVTQVEAHVHRMRFPGEKDDRFLVPGRPLDLGQLALFARLDQLEVPEIEEVLLQHLEYMAIAVIAGLDPVDGVLQGRREAVDVIEGPQTRLPGVGGNGEGVLRAAEVGAHHVDRPFLDVLPAVGVLGRHPIAEEHVDILVFERGKGDRHRQQRRGRCVPQVAQHLGGQCGGRGDVGPAHVGEAHDAAGGRVGLRLRRQGARGSGAERSGESRRHGESRRASKPLDRGAGRAA